MTTDGALAPERKATFRDVLAVKEFRALYVAQTLSIAGDQVARIAVAVLVFQRSHSTVLTGLSYAVSYLPWIIGGPLLSRYADRLPRRQVMILCDVCRAVGVAIMAVAGLPIWILIVIVAVVALAEPPFDSARSTTVPDILGEGDLYAVASTLGNSTNQLAVVLGFALGGGLVAAIGTHGTLIVDAGSFALSALVAWRYVSDRPAASPEPSSIRDDLRIGIQAVFRDARLRWLVVTTWLILGVTVSIETAAVPLARAQGAGSTTAGLLIASLPLGMVVGALILGRAFAPSTSERLMLPLALLAPAILAFTGFDPSAPVVGAIWFVAGVASAVTVIANRIFMVAVPREVRGRAFGIAVTGITAAQGLFSLLTGLVARYAGPAHAVADLALPTFALLVVFSVFSVTFRGDSVTPEAFSNDPSASITTKVEDERKDLVMAPRRRHPEARAWSLNLVMLAGAASLLPSLSPGHTYSDVNLPAWWLFAVFLLGQVYPLNFEIRRKSFQVVLETIPLVLGLVFLSPMYLVGLRVGAIVVVHAFINKLPWIKWFFNAVSTGLATLVAIEVFRGMAPHTATLHPSVWLAVFAAVITSEVITGLLVIAVLALTGVQQEFGRAARVIGFGVLVSVALTFLALFTAAALDYDTSTAWAISVFVALTIAGAQTYHRVAERAEALDRLYIVARELGPIAAGPGDMAPAMIQLRQVIRAKTLELAVSNSSEDGFISVVTVTTSGGGEDQVVVEERKIDGGLSTLVSEAPARRFLDLILHTSPYLRRQNQRVSAHIRLQNRDVGVLSADGAIGKGSGFERSDLRLLEAAADQLAAALEKGRLVDSLRRAATLDTLTGLANLDSLRSFLDTTLEGAAGGVLILLNLDRFREVNDMLGHEAGDAVLAEVARRLESWPTHGALCARVGGDQFAIAIPGAAGSEVARLAAMAIKSRVDGSLRLADVSADIRVTVGIARAPEQGSDAATLLRRAEMAMAAAKGGTSGIGEWEAEYERDGSRRLQLLTGLRAALSDGSLRVEYQPKLRLVDGEVTGFEALVRWSHPEIGPVSPAEFVPLAEATGLISALTSTVLRQALTSCRTWHDAGKPVGVAVNVSARSLDDSVLVGQVAAMLTASGLEPRWLTLEITESSVMEDHSRSLEVLRELRMLGVRLSIDDFGTGYSSLHQLRGLPVHEVKIDKSFVDTVDVDDADRAVVRAVVELCESLDLVTVAEGVESASQAFALDSLGVRQVQGYFHGRPMTSELAGRWLESRPVASFATTELKMTMG